MLPAPHPAMGLFAMRHLIDDVRIQSFEPIPTPSELRDALPVSDRAAETVYRTREAIKRILRHEDDRLLVVVGPCSIHDPQAAMEYAARLRPLCQEYADDLVITMRVYFEKPRTTVGWKGLVNDPNLDGTFNVRRGLWLARHLLVELAEMQVPAGSEFVDLISPQYTAELVSWPLVRGPRKASHIVNWLPGCPARSASRTALVVRFKSQWMPCARRANPTPSCHTPRTAARRCFVRQATRIATSFCAEGGCPTTTRTTWRKPFS